MEKFISFVILTVLAFYLLGFLSRLVGPWLMSVVFRKAMKQSEANVDEEKKKPLVRETKQGTVLRATRKEGQSLSDMLGGEYTICEEIKEE